MTHAPAAPVDPWAMQQMLMEASDQLLPARPELNKGVLLYQALNLEEGAETICGITRALERSLSGTPALEYSQEQILLAGVLQLLKDCQANMTHSSKQVRKHLEGLRNDYRLALTRSEIKEIADGCTDLTVTNSGLTLSAGLDGAACYVEVGSSNLSKRNPDDGKIHKTPDGKWIKDPRTYREPNLEKVIFGDVRPDLDDVVCE